MIPWMLRSASASTLATNELASALMLRAPLYDATALYEPGWRAARRIAV